MGKILPFFMMMLISISVLGQRVISGTVNDTESGEPIPGATVLIKGTATGTTTDIEGNYKIEVPGDDATLVFSFIGYQTLEEAVGRRSVIDVTMQTDLTELSEVVVTALGIEKDTRTLAYSVGRVEGENLTQAREVNVANSLVGRVAGVNVSAVSGGPGASSNVIIRGVNSLSGAGPLYVINGVPIDNTTRGSAGMWGGADFGDGIANLNPDDIEEITVLKGAAAGALYGSRAAGGVVIITTKKGKNTGGIGIEVNSNFTSDNVMNLTDFQYVYGHGSNGAKPASVSEAQNTGSSWGGLLDGSSVPQFDGESRPYVAQKDNYDNFYRAGSTFTNTVSLQNGNDKGSYRVSASNMTNKSVVPGSGLDRNTFNLNLNYKLVPDLTFDLVSNFVMEDAKRRPFLSDSPGNANFGVTFLPTSYDVRDLEPGYDPLTGDEIVVNQGNIFYTNPWFAANRFENDTRRRRLINVALLKYNFTDWLSLQGRVGYDMSFDRRSTVTPTGTAYRPGGDLTELSTNSSELNSDLLLSFYKNVTDKIGISANLGGNIRNNKWENISSSGSPFSIPFLYVIGNTVNRNTGYEYTETEVHSLYYSAELSYDNMLFLNTTGRQDWFSALDGRSIFYPSAGASFVFSELMDVPVFSFGKVRASWSQTTSDPSQFAYQTALNYNLSGSANGYPLGQIANAAVPNIDLQPNAITEIETGVEVSFFNNRLSLDAAYYNRQVEDEPLNVTISRTSGYTGASLNVGRMENKGIELLLSGTPVRTPSFSWTVSVNYTKNNNKVLALADGLEEIRVDQSRSQNAFVSHVVGYPASQVMAFDYQRDPNGNIIYDADGYPVQGELKPYGSGIHSTFGGINNDLTFKGFNFSFLIDYKFDGSIFSATDYYAYVFGLHKNTLEGRGENIVGEGVVNTGTGDAPVYTANTTGVSPWNYYGQLANRVSSEFVYDASFIKLRQVVLGYTFPSKLLGDLPIQAVKLSFVARNLAILMRETPNVDPESNINNTLAQGLELAGVPSTRSYGFNLNIKF